MWQAVNDRIARRVMALLETEKRQDENTAAKVRYALLVFLDEGEKFVLLSLLFGFFYDLGRFYLAFLALGSLRIFMGGSHRQTKLGCLLSSLVSFTWILGLSEFYTVPVQAMGGLAVLLVLEIIYWAPLASPQQLHYGSSQKNKLKKRALMAMAVWGCLVLILPAELGNIVFWAWVFQAAEVLLVGLYRGSKMTAKTKM